MPNTLRKGHTGPYMRPPLRTVSYKSRLLLRSRATSPIWPQKFRGSCLPTRSLQVADP